MCYTYSHFNYKLQVNVNDPPKKFSGFRYIMFWDVTKNVLQSNIRSFSIPQNNDGKPLNDQSAIYLQT